MDEYTSAPAATQDIPSGPDSQWQDMTAEENPAKRRRGRPPKDPNAPKRTYTKRTTSSRRSLKDQIGGTLVMLNLAFAFMPAPWRDDALNMSEITALADALDNAAKANPTLHKYMSTVLVEGGSMADLVLVGALIAGRRLARHGVIAAEFDERLGTFIDARTGITETGPVFPVSDASA